MARHATHKTGQKGKARTIAMRQARALKRGQARTNRSGR